MGLEPTTNGLKVRSATNENVDETEGALHWAQQSFQEWAVLLVDARGENPQSIATARSFAAALAVASEWQAQRPAQAFAVVLIPVA